jgi:hypothetical protein
VPTPQPHPDIHGEKNAMSGLASVMGTRRADETENYQGWQRKQQAVRFWLAVKRRGCGQLARQPERELNPFLNNHRYL